MIFLSYNHHDTAFVDVLANRMKNEFGQNHVFYDQWSVQPGDGIIGRMSEGLARCRFFFFFVTKRSLASKMVELEWQNALMKSVAGECKFIPVRAEDCPMPDIFRQTLYIDLLTMGIDETERRMVNVVRGQSSYQPKGEMINLIGTYSGSKRRLVINLCVQHFMEPSARFAVLLSNAPGEVTGSVSNEGMYGHGFQENVAINGGQHVFNALLLSRDSPLTPQFPMELVVTALGSKDIDYKGVLHHKAANLATGVLVFPANNSFVLPAI